jgi:hypothetical protein
MAALAFEVYSPAFLFLALTASCAVLLCCVVLYCVAVHLCCLQHCKISDELYARHDGTRTYFFSLQTLSALLQSVGFEIEQNVYHYRVVRNVKEQKSMKRNWIQCKARRPLANSASAAATAASDSKSSAVPPAAASAPNQAPAAAASANSAAASDSSNSSPKPAPPAAAAPASSLQE